jgi:indolepyruvate ferredoxin oxidoreductase
MTGGQPVDSRASVPEIARQIEAEGVARVAVLAEDAERWRRRAGEFPLRTSFHSRVELDAVQRELRATPGVTALIYDQVCATEQRRRVKRGLAAARTRRVFIHPEVCENCGDCTALSNCVAIRPLATPLGRKRQIDQSVCNHDYACLEANCPAMVTVEGGELRKKAGAGAGSDPLARAIAKLPDPPVWQWTGPYDLVITGVGGTGVITLGALIAAHLAGKSASVLDFMGFAQKGGSVIAFVRLAERAELLNQARIDTQQADAMIACDLVVGASPEALQSLTRGRTRVAANLHQIPTAAFVADPDADVHAAGLLAKIRHAIGTDAVAVCDAQDLAERLLGDTITANVLLLGFAWQFGLVPIGRAAIVRALQLNAVEVEANQLAFSCGRLAAADPESLRELLGEHSAEDRAADLDTIIERARGRLTVYQDARYAQRYAKFVETVRAAERSVLGPGAPPELTRQVALNYAKLLACKDEYEVARMYSDGSLERSLGEHFAGEYSVRVHLAPEYLVRERADGRPRRKLAFGRWLRPALGLLARARIVRGTPLDPFGWSAARRAERALAAEYAATVARLLHRLDADNHASAVRIAALPDRVRGFGNVKRAAADRMRAEARRLSAGWR